MAVDISAFCNLESFKKTAGDILRELRASKKAPGQDRIYTAGEKEYLAWQYRKDKGVPVNGPLQRDMLQLKRELGLNQYKFPFEE
jgi:LDH2 family malate/lactate/ureidoglycolate dehydrogenase